MPENLYRPLRAAAVAFAFLLSAALPSLAADRAVSAEVARPIKEAQALVADKNYAAALKKIREAAVVPDKTAYESFIIDDYTAFIMVQLKDYGGAARAYEASLDSAFVPASDRARRIKALVQLNYAAQNYAKVVSFGSDYQREAGDDADIQKLVVQALYLQGEYARAADAAKRLAHAVPTGKGKPDEAVLKLWLSAAYKQGDAAARRDALMALVNDYPAPDYWTDLLNLMEREGDRTNRMSLELLRLRLATGRMVAAQDYLEMSQLALQLGLPGEAVSVMQKGFAAGMLGGGNKGRATRLLDMARKEAAADSASLSTNAATAAEMAALGEAYASYGRYGEAVSFYRRALASDFADADLARLHLGQALLASGDRQHARAAFDSVKGAKLETVARVWSILSAERATD